MVLFEHPEWQKPLFAALDRRGVTYAPFDLKRAAFDSEPPQARLYFNQASPSAYVRGNARAVPFAVAFLRHLEAQGARVLNGSAAFSLELSKSAQVALLRRLGIDHPRTVVFNHVDALRHRRDVAWPAMLKPEQGGSGARMQVVNSFAELQVLLEAQPELWLPDNLLLLQEYLPHDPETGIVRMEFLGGEVLYPMRVVSHGRFNLCPSEVCNPSSPGLAPAHDDADRPAAPPVEFYPFPQVPQEAVQTAGRIFAASGLDVGGIEYLETPDGRRVFYDINANSNLRPAVAQALGFDPFDRVVDYLLGQLARAA